jgi:hypothetical protein
MEKEEAPAKSLIAKLAEVMASLKHVPKRGRNDFHKYDYATEADIADAVREGLASRGIMMIPSVQSVTWREVEVKSGKQAIATLTVLYRFTDGTQDLEFVMVGEGQDSGDKAIYKAMTGATKYALLKFFLMSTGDDPEKDDEKKDAPKKAKESPPVTGLGEADLNEVMSAAKKGGAGFPVYSAGGLDAIARLGDLAASRRKDQP